MLANHAQTRAHTHTRLLFVAATPQTAGYVRRGEFGFGAICHPYARRGNTRKIENLISKTAHTRHRSARAPNRHPTLTQTPTSWCVLVSYLWQGAIYNFMEYASAPAEANTVCPPRLPPSPSRIQILGPFQHAAQGETRATGPASPRYQYIYY